jgi:hypothetical protein
MDHKKKIVTIKNNDKILKEEIKSNAVISRDDNFYIDIPGTYEQYGRHFL